MEAKLGRKYKIGGDGWWHITEGVPILETDDIEVTDIDDRYVHIVVRRGDVVLGYKPINHTFFPEDFELVP